MEIDVKKEDEIIMPEATLKKTLQAVKYVRVGKTYSKEMAKIEIGTIMPEESKKAWNVMKRVLEDNHTIEWRYGVPPRGPHERKIADIMGSMGLLAEMEDW